MTDSKPESETTPRHPRSVYLRRHSTGGAVSFGDTADLLTETEDVDVSTIRSQCDKHVRLLLAGGISGSVGKSITAPLSRLTILYQVHSLVSTRKSGSYSSSIFGAMSKVWRAEGLGAFWKGNGTSVIHRFPYSAINFLTYETVKTMLTEVVCHHHHHHHSSEEDTSSGANPSSESLSRTQRAWIRFASGACAGAVATCSCYPLDLIRTRLATQLDSNIKYRGILHAVQVIRHEEGARGLYRGLVATCCVTVPNLAINFTLYESMKEQMIRRRDDDSVAVVDPVAHLTAIESLVCGAVAGIMSSLTTFPIDVLRRRLQLHTLYSPCSRRSSGAPDIRSIASSLYQEQGVRGFYRGLTPELLKVVPMVGITFGSFDRMKKWLQVDD